MRKAVPAASPVRDAILAQGLGSLVAATLIYLVWPQLWQLPLAVAAVQGACAALTAYKLEAPPWWLAIHFAFAPLVVAASSLAVAPGWYLAAFVALLLVFWRTDKSRVPLFLTNATAAAAVAALLPARPCHVVDLGCGNGGLLRRLARARPDCEFFGLEHAPLPWLWARLTTLNRPNVTIRYGDFWALHLGLFDVVYAFLSPAPMPRLWQKAAAEMKPDSLLVSNSFAVPDVAPDATAAVGDRRATRLYVYRPAK
ncbi:MAG: class I SAM-dependent methyltransferase [Rhodocyclaceae bacterium]|nr:class I SAM-dependent methyltransferase [Rhodocyclaceae bacterium]